MSEIERPQTDGKTKPEIGTPDRPSRRPLTQCAEVARIIAENAAAAGAIAFGPEAPIQESGKQE